MSDLEQTILDRAGKAMSDEIDFTILCGMLEGIGWTKVVLRPMTWEDGAEIDVWVEKHVKRPFETMGLVWIFEDAKEATWFTLKWL